VTSARDSDAGASSMLSGVAAFAGLSPQTLALLDAELREEHYAPGVTVVSEGDVGDRLFVVVEGEVEVLVAGAKGPVPVAVLSAGDLFGEMALLAPGGVREATVVALTALRVRSLPAEAFHTLLASQPEFAKGIDASVEILRRSRFLKMVASPFGAIEPHRRDALAASLTLRTVEAGDEVVHQGDPGEAAFLVRRGRFEVLLASPGEAARRLGVIGVGALFGEAALLTGEPRNASVRALEAGELLVLERSDLLAALADDSETGRRMMELHRLRARPRQAEGIIVHRRVTSAGETVFTLKDPRQGRYYRLSPEGHFLWERLDGRHNLRDLTLDLMVERGSFAPEAVQQVLAGLSRAGFLHRPTLAQDVADVATRRTGLQRVLGACRRLVDWRIAISGADPVMTRLYRAGIRHLYSRPAQIVQAGLVAFGLYAFATSAQQAGSGLVSSAVPLGWGVLLLPAFALSLLLHEAGHAFAVKSFSREVHRMGIGWHWVTPIAYVDTSDMWLAPRWPRIAVSLAGPWANAIIGSLVAIGAWSASEPAVVAALWSFAALQYYLVLMNLNPLLETDGYYVLIDWLERPNLRPRALKWWGQELLPSLRGRVDLRGHVIDLVYGLGSMVYIAALIVVIVVVHRHVLQDWLATLLPAALASGVAWGLGGLVVFMAGAGIAADLGYAQPKDARPAE